MRLLLLGLAFALSKNLMAGGYLLPDPIGSGYRNSKAVDHSNNKGILNTRGQGFQSQPVYKDSRYSDSRLVFLAKDQYVAGSSRAERLNKSLSVGLEPLGFVPFLVHGAFVDFHIFDSHLLNFSYSSGDYEYLVGKVDAEISSINWLGFWGNSFFTKVGISQRKISVELDYGHLMNQGFDKSEITADTINSDETGINLAIGNRWQWTSYFFGVEWAGYSVPVASQTSVNLERFEERSLVRSEAFDNIIAQYSPFVAFQFLRLQFGVSF